jgi:ADP-ribose pyrophosphatase YjhB (NUDIX family)
VGDPPAANALRELHEETGFDARLERLVGVYDNKTFASVAAYQFYICCFRGRITGGTATPSIETPEVVLADPAALPEDMSRLQRAMIADALAVDRPAAFQ